MAKRMSARVADETMASLVKYSDRLGITQSQLAGMAIQVGLRHLLQVIDPIGSAAPEDVAKVIEAMKLNGVELDVPGITDAKTSQEG